MQVTNLNFSTEELQILKNTSFFEIKRSVTKKIMELFSGVEEELRKEFVARNFHQVEEGLNRSGKIFRGENYLNLPYVVLDYPRHFSKESVFAFRSMFWWGNGFSFTLHLQGKAWERYQDRIIPNLEKLHDHDMYLCIGEGPWEYHYGAENYIPLKKFLGQGIKSGLYEKDFFKISTRLETDQYENVHAKALSTFRILLRMLDDQEPM